MSISMPVSRPRAGSFLRRAVPLAGALLAIAAGCGKQGSNNQSSRSRSRDATPSQMARMPATSETLELVFPYGSEKKHWLTEVTERFNQAGHTTTSGKRITVRAMPMGSGETMREILDGRIEAHLWSPASAAFVRLGNAESQTTHGHDLVGPTTELVLSPVVIAMWQPMAEAIGWGERPVGWSEILELAHDEAGWATHGFPQWGRFKFGHTHPEFSNSGLISLFAEVYAATGKTSGLTIDDVAAPQTGAYLREIERAVVHYGSSTGFFGRKLFGNGPEYLSAAVLYENMVIESYDRRKYPDLPFPVVAIYPKEGTFWSDHPVGIVQRDWVTDEHRAAAEQYIEFLTDRGQQERAMAFGFRPADPLVPMAAPLDRAHGIDPAEPKTTLEVPSVDVMDRIIALWHANKKHADIALVFDTSGSMKGRPLAQAKAGAMELIDMMGDADTLAVLQFHSTTHWLHAPTSLSTGRRAMKSSIGSLFADGGTALYDAIQTAHAELAKSASPDRISAIVVLTDGADKNSSLSLDALAGSIAFDSEGRAVRIFTIGYGDGASHDILKRIADDSQAAFHQGTTENIREVFKAISTFF